MRESADVTKEINDLKQPGAMMPRLLTEMGSERDAIYDSFESAEAPPKEEPKEPEVKADAETKEPKKAEFVKEEIKTEEEEKKVPYGALKEEREKRKALSSEVKELKSNLSQLIEDNKKLMELMSSKSDDEPITDYEKELVNLRKQNKMLAEKLNTIERSQVQREQKATNDSLMEQVRKVDKELAAEGFKGFEKLKFQVIEAMDAEEIPPEDRNPTTWKRVYKEIVYPELFGEFQKALKESKKEEKEALKKDASLVKSPGKADAKKEAEDDLSEYWKMREKFSFMNRAYGSCIGGNDVLRNVLVNSEFVCHEYETQQKLPEGCTAPGEV